MRSSRVGTLVCFLLLLEGSAGAQQISISGTTASQDPQAVNLVKESLSALLGSATTVPRSIVASGTVIPSWDNSVSPYIVRVYVDGTDKFRWEEDLRGGTTATVVNGQEAQSHVVSTVSTLMPWNVGAKKLENFPILLLSRWLSSTSMRFQLKKEEDGVGNNTQNLIHIGVVDLAQKMRPQDPWHRDGNRGMYELYLDPITHYPVRLHYYQETSDRIRYSLAAVDVVYSDYRVMNGSAFPLVLTRYLGSSRVATIQLHSIQPNGAVSSGQFQIQ